MTETFLTHSLPDRTVILDDGREFLWFSGTDYLGMGHDEQFQAFLIEGIRTYGTHFGSSRNNTLRLAVYEEAEEALAAYVQAPAALAVSSGMWAGQLVMKAMEKLSARFHYAPRVHPALWGKNYVPTNGTWADWVGDTIRQIEESDTEETHVVCTDSIGSPWVDAYDLTLLHGLPDNRPIWLIVDDSHSLGVLGLDGQGIFSQLPQTNTIRSIVTSSLNKALGIPGGVIFGSMGTIEELRQTPWFAGSSPAAPAYFYALRRNLSAKVYQKAHGALLANLAYFSEKVPPSGLFSSVEAYPAYCSRRADLYSFLYQAGILTSCFAYPQPTDEPVTRLVITARHQKQDLDRLAEVLLQF
ncbi:aminotransferase class I/II-fold pyridoxal phosphate-dependent enzyme [Salmonirosea aquatica]|uniref:Aminotransferase class I/II-fold pyridoxal phosphate-dependent enzyme n=1 Tax=Salmonirosea aquatica TaxID=2654236 RepID=A0A7C9BI07_9BACT|nr:aminotransferase class I/II-fold pyridoxal phosphate-dependent enzyme [Cytophagaceae bacterium SJW1-29]